MPIILPDNPKGVRYDPLNSGFGDGVLFFRQGNLITNNDDESYEREINNVDPTTIIEITSGLTVTSTWESFPLTSSYDYYPTDGHEFITLNSDTDSFKLLDGRYAYQCMTTKRDDFGQISLYNQNTGDRFTAGSDININTTNNMSALLSTIVPFRSVDSNHDFSIQGFENAGGADREFGQGDQTTSGVYVFFVIWRLGTNGFGGHIDPYR